MPRKNFSLLVLCLLFSVISCATQIPLTELQAGRPINEIQSKISVPPRAVKSFPCPDNNKETMTVLEYDLAPPKTNQTSPHWILFYQDKLVSYGLGYSKDAEYSINRIFFNYLVKENVISPSNGERMIYEKYKNLYGNENPFMDELFAYKIMILDALDKGEIEKTQAEYLISKKQSEISERVQSIRNQQAQQQAQVAAQKQAANIALLQMLQNQQLLNQNQQVLNQQLQPHTYTIMPFGQGYIMQGR